MYKKFNILVLRNYLTYEVNYLIQDSMDSNTDLLLTAENMVLKLVTIVMYS